MDYIVEAKLTSEAATQWRRFTARPTTTSYQFNIENAWTFPYGGQSNVSYGSASGTRYDFRVQASNDAGQSAWVGITARHYDSGG